MIEQDTVKLLRECDAGTKMAISSINEILEKVEYTKLRAGDRSGKGKDDFELILYPKLPKS